MLISVFFPSKFIILAQLNQNCISQLSKFHIFRHWKVFSLLVYLNSPFTIMTWMKLQLLSLMENRVQHLTNKFSSSLPEKRKIQLTSLNQIIKYFSTILPIRHTIHRTIEKKLKLKMYEHNSVSGFMQNSKGYNAIMKKFCYALTLLC